MSKKLYHYDPKTGLLVGTSIAQEDVKASSDKPVYLKPLNCTFQVPPVVNNERRVAKFDLETNSWIIVDDFRGLKVVEKATKKVITWNQIGRLPEEYTFKQYDNDLVNYISWIDESWKVSEEGRQLLIDDIWNLRKAIREAECSSDISYNDHLIHVDPTSFNDIMLAAQEALISGDMTTSKRWVTADNLDVQLNGYDFIAIARAYGARRQRLVYESNEAWQEDIQRTNEELVEVYKDLRNYRG